MSASPSTQPVAPGDSAASATARETSDARGDAPQPSGHLALIRSRHRLLSKAEQQVAECILSDPTAMIYLSITEIADRADVGEATVSRFCRRLGFRGFQDLKIGIAQELSPSSVSSTDGVADSPPTWIDEASRRSIAMIDRTALLLSPSDLTAAVEMIAGGRKIDFYGQGASALTALDAQHRFLRLGKLANAPLDTHTQAMSSALLGRGDVAVSFSFSGSSKDVVTCQQTARRQGAGTICVTGTARSPIAAASDIVLLTAGEETLVSNLRSKIVQLFVLELLVEGCAKALGPAAQEALDLTTNAVVGKMY